MLEIEYFGFEHEPTDITRHIIDGLLQYKDRVVVITQRDSEVRIVRNASQIRPKFIRIIVVEGLYTNLKKQNPNRWDILNLGVSIPIQVVIVKDMVSLFTIIGETETEPS
ncbi:hypothetical protein A2801_02705 [Candidatus Woesebacteria bacterium RIFCSPHIGHO2_01_FULL_41_10]|uniref:Uncharacterized protein n=1 Tax=Candidatus Woesebacteria bacterium RIFCSPHIGHO2_01_FULL_41_10 TaxID=1802500 RepID=A0A1F7YPK8_9BACT|nr:MAG: hypothetical protein A2801_02705 [Candidatus Woesebacteria bacterium RIFCSPHIGHO2_01_FULL_41_10]